MGELLGELCALEPVGKLEQLGELAELLTRFEQRPKRLLEGRSPCQIGYVLMRLNQDQIRPLTELLIVQPTPFCNINCDYCYLSGRESTKRMPMNVLDRTMEELVTTGLLARSPTIVWHAGEPLTIPPSYYHEAFERVARCLSGYSVSHSIQTNGTLISDKWCALFHRFTISVGVSVDGPDFIHNQHRKDRRGAGTHDKVMRGIECLKRNDVPFHAIAVVTADSLQFPDQIFSFFSELGATSVGFNIEESEGEHVLSTVSGAYQESVVRFFERLYALQSRSDTGLRIREFDRAYQAIALGRRDQATPYNQQVVPLAILSVDCDGNVSTFSPELLGARSTHYDNFQFGNIVDQGLRDIITSQKFRLIVDEIGRGVQMCARSCEYFAFCGGGAPANKYFENGTFASTETVYCQNMIQAPIDVVLARLETELGLKECSSSLMPVSKRVTAQSYTAVPNKLVQISGAISGR
jgi:uncharacterized protein